MTIFLCIENMIWRLKSAPIKRAAKMISTTISLETYPFMHIKCPSLLFFTNDIEGKQLISQRVLKT